MIVRDNFIDNFLMLCDHTMTADFNAEVNEVDGAVYPAIDFDIPNDIKEEFINKIEAEKGFEITPNLVFLRANPKGEKEPYQAHNDSNMGEYTCILYIKGIGGTSFLKHKKTGMDENDPNLFDDWLNDCNNEQAWEVTEFCEIKPNRALFFDAKKMHRGEPVEGYGAGNNSRMIMVCFYDREH